VFHDGAFRLAIPDAKAEPLKPYINKQLNLGIRPEDIHAPSHRLELASPAELEATLEVMEPMGSEIYLHLTSNSGSFIANVEPDFRPELGKPTKLVINMDKSHFFDPDTGLNLMERV
jgi:multiple sugar transport system ATP-binding protein